MQGKSNPAEVIHYHWKYSLFSTYVFLFVSALDSALSNAPKWTWILLACKLLSDMVLLALVLRMRPCSVGIVNHMLVSVWGVNLLSTVSAVIAFFVDDSDNAAPNVVFVVGTLGWVLARVMHLCYLKKNPEAAASSTTLTTQ